MFAKAINPHQRRRLSVNSLQGCAIAFEFFYKLYKNVSKYAQNIFLQEVTVL